MRENFREAEIAANGPINVTKDQQRTWFLALHLRLHGKGRVTCKITERTDGKPIDFGIYVDGVANKYHDSDGFDLQFRLVDENEGLFIQNSSFGYSRGSHPWVPVCRIEQIESFLTAVQARQDQNHLRDKQKEKVINLLKSNLTGQLRELARIHNFEFAVSEHTRGIILSLRIGDTKSGFHVSFAKSRLQEMLDRIPRMVTMIQEFEANGIRFSNGSHAYARWIEPDKKQSR